VIFCDDGFGSEIRQYSEKAIVSCAYAVAVEQARSRS